MCICTCVCRIASCGVLFIKQIFNGPSCVGAILGTLSVNKAVSAHMKLPFCVEAAGTCADLERKPAPVSRLGWGQGGGRPVRAPQGRVQDAALYGGWKNRQCPGPHRRQRKRGARPSRTERGSQGLRFAQDCPDFCTGNPQILRKLSPKQTWTAGHPTWDSHEGTLLIQGPEIFGRPQKYFHSFKNQEEINEHF